MNLLQRRILDLVSSPKLNMQEDYTWIRFWQELLSKPLAYRYGYANLFVSSSSDQSDILVRIFTEGSKRPKSYEGAIIYIHGGGWTTGTVDSYARLCQRLARRFQTPVFSIDYRLAPEYPFPIGFNDCYDVVNYLMATLGTDNLILMGDSAGGNLAAALSLRLRDEEKTMPKKQVLLYPVTNWRHDEETSFYSVREKGYDYGLTMKKMQEYMDNYEPNEGNRANPYISPLLADDYSNQPQTLVITAENDLLRDEGEAYAVALEKAGNQVDLYRLGGALHGFITKPERFDHVQVAYKYMEPFLKED